MFVDNESPLVLYHTIVAGNLLGTGIVANEMSVSVSRDSSFNLIGNPATVRTRKEPRPNIYNNASRHHSQLLRFWKHCIERKVEMKAYVVILAMVTASGCIYTGRADAQTRYLLMEGTGEFGWSIARPSKINGEAEGRSLALEAVNGKVEGMANIQAFEQFSKTQVVNTLKNRYEQIGSYMSNTTTFTRDDKKENAFKGNKRGLVVTVQEMGFKRGTFQNTSDYNKLTGVRKSRASGILLYKFRVRGF